MVSRNSTRSPSISVSGIRVYPIKSAAGIVLDEAIVEERGFRHDRRWMLVDDNGVFLSQREAPRLALVRVAITDDALVVAAPGMSALQVPLQPEPATVVSTIIWRDVVESWPVGEKASRWFREFLGTPCSLVYLPETSVRPVDPAYSTDRDQVGLADGFPFLLLSEASLGDLNSRMERPLPMDRFRPNLIVRDCGPFAEDGWRRVRIGPVDFRVVKPCARCAITLVDQQTAVTGKEPLRTLARYRKRGSDVLFGQNLIHDLTGTVRVGDAVQVIEGAA
ncbi:MAG TPA: MOSC N-terminal beta barrel domain-containing protein [Rubrobacteraceae bacterium]|nr:MOSC N-terminal beta barrel domain-containing protein [Rubrobacteraceae bacterium]